MPATPPTPPRATTAHDETPLLEHLTLDQLRGYRQQLREEEDRASYWRRVVHARLDMIAAGSAETTIGLRDLVRVLGDTGTGASRSALLRVKAADPLPHLPSVAEVWTTPSSPDELAQARTRLEEAEHQLTEYRTALFARLDECTRALIQRYRAHPAAALAVLG